MSSEALPTVSPLDCHDKDARHNLEDACAAQMPWGLRMTDSAINTFI